MTHVNIDKTLLPSNDALGFDALYVPANNHRAEGACYDAFGITNQRFVVWIGNVAGSAAEAAGLRLAVRNAVGASAAPAGAGTVLGAADALLGRQTAAAAACATAIVGIVDCTDRTFSYVTAGHPAPLIRCHDGVVAALPADGLADRDHPRAQVVVHLDDAAVLLLYSRALVQAVKYAGDGMCRLQRVFTDERTADCGSPAVRLAQRMLGGRPHADVALLTVSFPRRRLPFDASTVPSGERPRWSVSWSFDTAGDTSNGARRAFLAFLRSTENGKAIDLPAAELVFGELLGNVVRHAPGPVEITLDWTAEVPLLHVLDSGRGFRSRRARERLPVDDFSETGRGLFIITAFATKFSVRNRKGCGTHACATLALV